METLYISGFIYTIKMMVKHKHFNKIDCEEI